MPDPRLKQVSEPVEAVTDDLRLLMDDMVETMHDAKGIGLAAIQDQAYAQQTWASVRRDRKTLAEGLTAMGFDVAASQTNFVLAQTPRDVSALHLYQALKDAGILVRYFNTPRLQDALRITVGTPEQNRQLLDQLDQLIGD